MCKVKIPGVDEDTEAKKMVVVMKWWGRQGPVRVFTQSSEGSKNEAIAEEERNERREWSLCVRFGLSHAEYGLEIHPYATSPWILLKSRSIARKQLFGSWSSCGVDLGELLLNEKKKNWISLLTKWDIEEMLVIWVSTVAGNSLLTQRRGRKSISQITTQQQITGKRRRN